jgi:hypothetical protein
MSGERRDHDGTARASFEALATRRTSSVGQAIGYFISRRKWWLIPMVVVLLGLGALFVLSGSVVAPFIYTLF